MKNVLRALSIIFVVLCFAGAGYVLYTGGQATAGYAVIPMLCSIVCSQGYMALKKNHQEE